MAGDEMTRGNDAMVLRAVGLAFDLQTGPINLDENQPAHFKRWRRGIMKELYLGCRKEIGVVTLIVACMFIGGLVTSDSNADNKQQQSSGRFDLLYKMAIEQLRQTDDCKGKKITRCAFIGTVVINEESFIVTRINCVIEGMLAPRGSNYLFLLRQDEKTGLVIPVVSLDIYNYVGMPEPLWCEGNRVFLFGRSKGVPTRTGGKKFNGNCLVLRSDLSGKIDYDLEDVSAYGSSGGIEDYLPSQAERERERSEWDSK